MMQANQLNQSSTGPELHRLMLGFLGILAIFALLLTSIFFDSALRHTGHRLVNLFLPAIGLLAVLGMVELLMAHRSGINRSLRFWLMLVAITAVGAPLSIILHNFLPVLLAGSKAQEEGFFFILATLVFPALFVAGVVGTFVSLLRIPEA